MLVGHLSFDIAPRAVDAEMTLEGSRITVWHPANEARSDFTELAESELNKRPKLQLHRSAQFHPFVRAKITTMQDETGTALGRRSASGGFLSLPLRGRSHRFAPNQSYS
jgi:hypothetical protein